MDYISREASISALTPETASSINTGQKTDQKAAALVRDLSALGLIPIDFIDKMIAEITPANIKKIFIVRNKENSDIAILYHLELTIVKKPGGHAALALEGTHSDGYLTTFIRKFGLATLS